MIEDYINIKPLFDNIIIYVSISTGLFGAFVSTIFSLKKEKKVKEVIESVSYRKQLRIFLYILVILSSVIVILSMFVSSINATPIQDDLGSWYILFVSLAIVMLISYIGLITTFFIYCIHIFTSNDE